MDSDGFDPLFPVSPVHSFNPFAGDVPHHPSSSTGVRRQGLDLNSQFDGWEHLEDYQTLLQSGGGGSSGGGAGSGGAGSGGLPPHPGRGRPTGNRTLGVRAQRSVGRGASGRGVRGGDANPAGRVRRARPTVSATAGGQGGRGRGGRGRGSAPANDGEQQNIIAAQHYDTAVWTYEPNNMLLCKLLVDQMRAGNYHLGKLNGEGYKEIEEKFYAATGLRHDKKAFGNRIGQLKAQHRFIQCMHLDSGLGQDENGWPTATEAWWKENTKNNAEWRKFKWGPPEYLPQLDELFVGVNVDGSTSFVAGANEDQQQGEEEEELEAAFEDPVGTPMSAASGGTISGGHKRSGSTSTTGTSPLKKTKSPMVRMMRDFFNKSTKTQEQTTSILDRVANVQLGQTEELKFEVKQAQDLAAQDGIQEASIEHYAVSNIVNNTAQRKWYIGLQTKEGRLAYLQRYIRQHNLDY